MDPSPPIPAASRRRSSALVVAESSLEVAAPPATVWALWLDVASRPLWHPRLEWARLDGPPLPGATGAWKPAGTRPVSVVISELEPQRRLVLRGTHGPPVARGHYEHEVEPLAAGTSRITHRMTLTGPLARPIGWVLGRPLGAFASPAALQALAALLPGAGPPDRR